MRNNKHFLLVLLKKSIPISSNAYDPLLTQYLDDTIQTFAADLQDDKDRTLVLLYAKWLWDSNQTPGIGKPLALQLAINNRAVMRDVR